MEWPPTLVALATTVSLCALFGWLGARPPNPAKGPRLIPYRFLMLLTGAGIVLLLIHVKELAGLGRN